MSVAILNTGVTFTVQVAWGDAPLDTTPTWVDITEDVILVQGVRGTSNTLSAPTAGVCTIRLRNQAGKYTPENTAGAYYPDVIIGAQVRVTATYSAVTYPEFRGHVSAYRLTHTDFLDTVDLTCFDALGWWGRQALATTIGELVLRETEPEYLLVPDPAGGPRMVNLGSETTTTNGLRFTSAPDVADNAGPFPWHEWSGEGGLSAVNLQAPSKQRIATSGNNALPAFGDYVEVWFTLSSFPPSQGNLFMSAQYDSAGTPQFQGAGLQVLSTGQLRTWQSPSAITNTGVFVTLDDLHCVSFTLTFSPGLGTYQDWYLDGVFVAQSFWADGWIPTGTVTTLGYIGTDLSAVHAIAGYATAPSDIRQRYRDVTEAYRADTPAARAARIAAWVDWPTSWCDFDGNTTRMTGLALGGTAFDALAACAVAEGGRLYVTGDNVLTLEARIADANKVLASPVAAWTDTDLVGDVTLDFDDELVRNPVTVTTAVGSATASSTAELATLGRYDYTLSVPSVNTWEASNRAKRLLAPSPKLRASDVTRNVLKHPLALAVNIGDYITLTITPTAGDSVAAEVIAERISFTVTPTSYTRDITLSDAPAPAAEYGTSLYGTGTYA